MKFLIIFLVLLTGCTSMQHQTNQDKVNRAIELYLPDNTTIKIVSDYEMGLISGSNRTKGLNTRYSNFANAITGCEPYRYEIVVVNDPVAVLHEICHSLQYDFHCSQPHWGLQGCDHFNNETVTRL